MKKETNIFGKKEPKRLGVAYYWNNSIIFYCIHITEIYYYVLCVRPSKIKSFISAASKSPEMLSSDTNPRTLDHMLSLFGWPPSPCKSDVMSGHKHSYISCLNPFQFMIRHWPLKVLVCSTVSWNNLTNFKIFDLPYSVWKKFQHHGSHFI